VNFKFLNKASFLPGLNVYCGPLLKSLPCASQNAGKKEMVWNIGPVNEYEAQSVIISFVGIIIQKEYELRQCHLSSISRRVATKKQS
jgi:hypothetical protein